MEALQEEWQQAPPIRRVLAAFAGYKAPSKSSGRVDLKGQAEALIQAFGSNGALPKYKPPLEWLPEPVPQPVSVETP